MNLPRIAMLTHSTLPRGGVVHAMSLSGALTALGAETVLHAPDASGGGFFGASRCETRAFPVAKGPRMLADLVEARIDDYANWFRREDNRRFDIYHAHDGLSGAALAALKREGVIPAFIRTVHHIDEFADPRLAGWQRQSIAEADALLTVSDLWRRRLCADFGRDAAVAGNGVDLTRYSPDADGREGALRKRWRLGDGPIFLTVGGIEARKNTLAMLAAFAGLLERFPQARLVVAGGASLLNHDEYVSRFQSALNERGSRAQQVVVTGPIADPDMPALYRLADVFVFASLKEGFGLCVLEAMACGAPVVVSRIAPFTEYLDESDALFCDPQNPVSIANAMTAALRPGGGRERRRATAAKHTWRAVAERCLAVYQRMGSPVYA